MQNVMMMMEQRNILTTIFFLLLLYVSNIQAYRKYYVEDECTSPDEFQKIVFKLPASGPDSVGELRSNRFGTYSRTGRNCLIKLLPPKGFGVVITVLRVDFRNHKECEDYIKISSNGKNSEKLCQLNETKLNDKTYFSDREIQLHYHTAAGGMGFSNGFRLIFTVSKLDDDPMECVAPDEFQCRNSHCIWAGVTCDGINNCGDYSDESSIGHPHCNEVTPIAIAAVVLGILSFLGVLILMCFCCCRPQVAGQRKPPLPESISLRPNAGYIPLPGYTYGNINTEVPYQQPIHSPIFGVPASTNTPIDSYQQIRNFPFVHRQKDVNFDWQPPPPYVA